MNADVPAPARGRAALFSLLVALPLALPLSSAGFSLLSQLASAWLLLLSVGLLVTRAGLLSFGQAMYAGLAAYAAAHAMNTIAARGWPLPFALVPVYGGMFAVAVALVLGPISVRRGGLSFAMITLGLGLLVALAAPMLQGFFGGEGGVSTDRTAGPVWLGLDFLSQRQVYGVSAAYVLLGAALMRGLDGTRLDLLARAVRDNPLRVAVSGATPRRVRLQLVLVSAFLAGLSGALQTLRLEQVSAGSLGLPQSSMALLFSLAAGSGTAWGALLGAGLMVGSESVLASVSQAWMLYVGLGFLAIVHRDLGAAGFERGLARFGARASRPPQSRSAVGPGSAIALRRARGHGREQLGRTALRRASTTAGRQHPAAVWRAAADRQRRCLGWRGAAGLHGRGAWRPGVASAGAAVAQRRSP
ncbi:branched-chain amino acid ABC transporter permease [Thiomonas sp. 13-64-67]|uniref:branched-chain amino acid ABC transporter permease n=1 Tax=Thiomonas sp. 13-64-67 TaxID=1970447 RepID=UPI00257F57FE|nr:branched-chain amino acid ABC transporter permease [Thiomonas sp. 13-64-67]